MTDIDNLTAGEAIQATTGNTLTIGNLYGLKYAVRDNPVHNQIIDHAIEELGVLNDEILTLCARIAEIEAQIADEREDAARAALAKAAKELQDFDDLNAGVTEWCRAQKIAFHEAAKWAANINPAQFRSRQP